VLSRVSEEVFVSLARARNAAEMKVLTDPARHHLCWGALDLGPMPDKRALRYYQNGHVLHLEIGRHPDADLLYVRGTVYASMKSQAYQCVVTLSSGEHVASLQLPQCSCAAGYAASALPLLMALLRKAGFCSHVQNTICVLYDLKHNLRQYVRLSSLAPLMPSCVDLERRKGPRHP
jgi:hypothetical protein